MVNHTYVMKLLVVHLETQSSGLRAGVGLGPLRIIARKE
jgi:hypothetical protein